MMGNSKVNRDVDDIRLTQKKNQSEFARHRASACEAADWCSTLLKQANVEKFGRGYYWQFTKIKVDWGPNPMIYRRLG